jgi:FkbM family methyltransferase
MVPPDGIIEVPGTNYWVLRDDKNLTPKALETKSIVIEHEIAALPEVKALQPGNVVLDIGAFIGDTALIFIERGCVLHTFETYEDAIVCLEHNLEVYTQGIQYFAYKIHPFAVGDGWPTMAGGNLGEADSGNLGTRMTFTDHRGEPSLRIDDLQLDRVDFVKIDVEGSEPLVLAGMIETLRRCRPKILIECYDTLLLKHGFTRHDIISRLHILGYRYRVAIGNEDDDRVDLLFTPLPK